MLTPVAWLLRVSVIWIQELVLRLDSQIQTREISEHEEVFGSDEFFWNTSQASC